MDNKWRAEAAKQRQTMASSTTADTVIVSKCIVKPVFVSEESKKPHYLTPWDLIGLNYRYVQFILLFNKPDDEPMNIILDRLKNSLAATLTHFVPFSGRFVTQNIQHPPSYCVYVDCKDPAGAEFVHAVASNVTISDILTPTDVPVDLISSLLNIPPGTTNNAGHTLPLLVVQVTELVDGICIGLSANHSLVDGLSYWHFVNSYSEVCRSTKQESPSNCVISHPPVISPCFLNNQLHLPGCHPKRGPSPQPAPGVYRQTLFHFPSTAIARLKTRANIEHHTNQISSYQALVALIWRSAIRARGLRGDQMTTCAFPINSRLKLEPPLSDVYFGNCFTSVFVNCTVDELLSNNLGWVAWKLHNQITNCDDNQVRSCFEQLSINCTNFTNCSVDYGDPGALFFGNSPGFDMFGNNFGWGNPLGVRSSFGINDGHVLINSGRNKGSIDVTITLFSKAMNALELDDEFTQCVTSLLSKI